MATPADTILASKTEIAYALRAIAEGYPVIGIDDRYVQVENPDYDGPDGRQNEFLVIDTFPIFDLLRCMGVSI